MSKKLELTMPQRLRNHIRRCQGNHKCVRCEAADMIEELNSLSIFLMLQYLEQAAACEQMDGNNG